MRITSFSGIKAVASPLDILRMRRVRNSVRGYMTHNTSEIGWMQQLAWYFEVYRPACRRGEMFGFLVWDDGHAIGYGLITRREGKFWVSGGLLPEVRGSGKGEFLFRFLTGFVHRRLADTCWLDVRLDNSAARKLYAKIGYRVTATMGTTSIMNLSRGGGSL